MLLLCPQPLGKERSVGRFVSLRVAPNIHNVAVSVALMLQTKFCALFLDAIAVPKKVVSATGMVQARQHPDAVTVDATTLPKEKVAYVIVMEANCTSPFAVFLCAALP